MNDSTANSPLQGAPTPTGEQEVAATAALREPWQLAAEQRVEIACSGGVERTGTALALTATLSGVALREAVAWVRAHCHRRAVETRRQRRFLEQTAAALCAGP